MSLNFMVYANDPIFTFDNPIITNSYKEEIELIKPLLLYADSIGLVSKTMNLMDIIGLEKFVYTNFYKEGSFYEALDCMAKDVKVLDKLSEVGIVKILGYPSIGELTDFFQHSGFDDYRTMGEALELLNDEELFLLMIILSEDIITPVCSQHTHKLLKEVFEKANGEQRQVVDKSKTFQTSKPLPYLFKHLSLQLPNFENTPVDEILDIRKELEKPLVRFRSTILKYSDEIKHIPDDRYIEEACNELYIKEIAPALLELEEAAKANSLVKNLGYKIFSDEGLLNKGLGGLTFGLMAPGALAAMSQSIPLGISAMIPSMVPATARVTSKVVQTVKEHQEKNKDIEGNSLYFLYEARRRLDKG